MTDQTPAERLRHFLDYEQAEGVGSDDTPVYDVVGLSDLTYGDLRAVLADRDQLAEKLTAATRTVATVAVQRNQLDRDLAKANGERDSWQHIAADRETRIAALLLHSDVRQPGEPGQWPPGPPQPHAPGRAAASAPGEPSNASSSPQRGAGDVEPTEIAAAEPVVHAEELDEHGHPTGYALCDQGNVEIAPVGASLANNAWRVNCEACLNWHDREQSEDEHPNPSDEDGHPDGFFDPQHQDEPAPHVVAVTHLPGAFDMNDRRPFEQLIGNGVAGWVSHQVQHPPACHQLPYGQPCAFDDEWENGHYTYDDIPPGLYHVQARAHDVGDHNGEYSHTEDYLDYQRVGDAPQRTVADPGPGYSSEAPF